MFSHLRINVLPLSLLLMLLAIVSLSPAQARAQEGIPVELPCVTGVTAFPNRTGHAG